jgi:acetyltransferase
MPPSFLALGPVQVEGDAGHLDYDREMALVAVHHTNGEPCILGVSRYYLDLETGAAEFAVAVGDPWQGQGLGYHLMRRLIEVARQNGVRRLVGQVLQENAGMLNLVKSLDFNIRTGADPSAVDAVLDLSQIQDEL